MRVSERTADFQCKFVGTLILFTVKCPILQFLVIKIWYTNRAKKHDECCEAMPTRDHDTEEKLSSSVGLNGNLILFMKMSKFHHENAQFLRHRIKMCKS